MTGKELRATRLRLCLTQAEMATRLDVSRNTIARWERGAMAIHTLRHDALGKAVARLTARERK